MIEILPVHFSGQKDDKEKLCNFPYMLLESDVSYFYFQQLSETLFCCSH